MARDRSDQAPFLGLSSGVGLVVANMIGAGVFLSAGFMAQVLGPMEIMAAWALGLVLALCGARAYGTVAAAVARSGGEYRYLSDLVHPFVGYLSGWGSLLLGFAAPVAASAYAVGAFLNTLAPGPDPRLTGALVIAVFALVHAFDLRFSRSVQNVLVAAKLGLVVGFVALGLALGSRALPAWSPPAPRPGGFPLGTFLAQQLWIAFAFSGWNAAVYAASEFRDPRRDVPRAMLVGCGLVGALYFLVNWVFVANLTPEQASAVFYYMQSRVTLGHLVARELLGPVGSALMSGFAILAFCSSVSVMTLVGPRVYAEMARDGYLPRRLAGREGRPPTGSVLLQSGLAVALLATHTIVQVVSSASVLILTFSALVAAASIKVMARGEGRSAVGLVAALVYAVAAGAILFAGIWNDPLLLLWVLGLPAVAAGYFLAVRRKKRG